jgi:hypothetical protein
LVFCFEMPPDVASGTVRNACCSVPKKRRRPFRRRRVIDQRRRGAGFALARPHPRPARSPREARRSAEPTNGWSAQRNSGAVFALMIRFSQTPRSDTPKLFFNK